jgi:hypothetical protein
VCPWGAHPIQQPYIVIIIIIIISETNTNQSKSVSQVVRGSSCENAEPFTYKNCFIIPSVFQNVKHKRRPCNRMILAYVLGVYECGALTIGEEEVNLEMS